MADPARLTGKTAAAVSLAKGETVAAAADAAGVNERTVRRWLADDEFAARVGELRSTMIDNAVGQLADAAGEAVQTLREMLAAESEPVRVRAARAILAAVVVLRESVELEDRLAELERSAQRDQHRQERGEGW